MNIFKFIFFGLALFGGLAASCELIMGEEQFTSKFIPVQSNTGEAGRVLWTVSAYKICNGAGWGENEARSLLFKPLDIGSSYITFNGRTCQGISFTSETFATDRYLSARYQTTPEILGILDETIQVIKTNCQLPGFSEYIRLTDRRLIVWIQGVFFVFEPNVKK
jgi:hypothetical protein